MAYEIDQTHDPKLQSWVESANDPETDFPIQNLPWCVFKGQRGLEVGACIGDMVLQVEWLLGNDEIENIATAAEMEAIEQLVVHREGWAHFPNWHAWWHLADQASLRKFLVRLLRIESRKLADSFPLKYALVAQSEVEFASPIPDLRNYTDFYASLHHATNVGSMFRPDNPLLPNYKWIPIGYHGRASSIVPSGTDVRRPRGQLLSGATIEDGPPQVGPCKLLDYELEVGAVIGRGNELGRAVSIGEAEEHIFGLCLVNDWSARDMQKWEYQPLGPFLAKSFATTISPYIVTMEALAPFRAPAFVRDDGDPQPLSYLDSAQNRDAGGFDITLEVYLQSEQMRARNMSPIRLSRGSFKDMYWTLAQMVTHHTSNGCNLQPGDLLASGTVSGPTRDARGCLLELTWDGDPWASPPKVVPGTQRTPIKLPTGEERKFLADGDEVIIRGYCQREGFRRIGFGECRGRILPAVE
ncbi:MAG: fumarylacetoacetase [Phycisphaerales bacterium JB039]